MSSLRKPTAGRVPAGLVRVAPTIVGVSARRKWSDLDPHVRRVIVVAGVVEGALKIAALVDLARRPADGVRGSKARWATAVTLLNSLGAVPIAYFVWGRHRPPA
jgi:hypothetical protein